MHIPARFTLRQLRTNPGFAIAAVATLAIGIGASTAIFSLVNSILLRPLPFPDPARLVHAAPLVLPPGSRDFKAAREDDISWPDFFDWRAQSRSFDFLAAFHLDSATMLNGSSAAAQLRIAIVSANFFQVLGIPPALGRTFAPSEELSGPNVIVLSHAAWQSQFHSDPAVIGAHCNFDGRDYTVIGVMPVDFAFPLEPLAPAAWVAAAFDAVGNGGHPSTEQRGWSQLSVIGRLRSTATMPSAQAELTAIQARLAARYPESDSTTVAAVVSPELDFIVGNTRPALRVLMAAVLALLLIACANVAGLLLARGEGRRSELAVRSALGATRTRIVRQLLSESLVLSALGGAAGIMLAWALLALAPILLPPNLPRVDHIAIDKGVLAFAVAASFLTGLIFGILPARRLSRVDPARFLRDGRSGASGRGRHRLHSSLVVAETALSLVLLIVAGLFMRSFLRVISVDPGFHPDHLLTFSFGVSPQRYSPEKKAHLYDRLLTRFESLPGVHSATAGFPLPLSGGNMSLNFRIQGEPVPAGSEPDAHMSYVEPNFLSTLGIQLLRGRGFTPADNTPDSKPVALVNEAFVRNYLSARDPIGKAILPGAPSDTGPWYTIVGVAHNVHRTDLAQPDYPEIYLPYGANPVGPASFVLRVAGDPDAYAHAVTSVIASIDPDLPVYRINPYPALIGRTVAQPRFQAVLIGAFAVVAFLLAAVSLYAVLSYTVTQRAFEIGLRIAVGASRSEVLRMILARGLSLAAIGLALGLISSFLLTRFLAHMLFSVQPFDAITFIAAATLLLAVSALASLAPAWLASRIDPIGTLRNQ